MKSKIIMAAVIAGAFPCVAPAMSVNLYGVADVNISYFHNSDGSLTSMNSGGLGGSRFGLRGTEKLSNDLDAIFVLEGGFNINDGTSAQGGRLFGRRAFVGLRSKDFGTLIAGRLQGPGYYFSGDYDPMIFAPGSVIGSLTGENPRPWMYNPLAGPARTDNSVQYTSPKVHGFQLNYMHSFRAAPNDAAPRSKSYDLASLTYAEGPLSVTYGFGRSTGTTYSTAATSNQTEHALGVYYKFPWATLFGTYQIRKTSGYSGTDRAWQVGARIPVSQAGKIHVAYGQSTNDTPYGATESTADWGVNSWAIGYVHSLSKRTVLYSYFKLLDNRGNARQTIFPPGGLPDPTSLGDRVTAFGIGMQHRF
ncbi:porin [Eoetvoesiella caeni]